MYTIKEYLKELSKIEKKESEDNNLSLNLI